MKRMANNVRYCFSYADCVVRLADHSFYVYWGCGRVYTQYWDCVHCVPADCHPACNKGILGEK